jgi:DNA-binding NtrC family response regulator
VEWCVPRAFPPFPFGEPDCHDIVGESPAIWSLRKRLAVIARREGHVLLRGQSGSGKELAAQAIHARSDRASKPLLARNAATIPDSLFDAELFGNLRDYPNRGTPERPGLVGHAAESTLFLDEVGELPAAQQAHLLRALDRGEYHRLGESTARVSNFRLVAATNRPDSSLKSDFFARFAFVVDVPDLQERREDVPLLVRSFLRSLAAKDPDLVQRFETAPGGEPRVSLALVLQLLTRDHPGNVRGLQALLLQSLVESAGPVLEPVRDPWPNAGQLLPGVVREPATADETSSTDSLPDDPKALTAVQLQAVLDRNNGMIEAAWRALGLKNRFVLNRLIAKHGLEVRRRHGQGMRRKPRRHALTQRSRQ